MASYSRVQGSVGDQRSANKKIATTITTTITITIKRSIEGRAYNVHSAGGVNKTKRWPQIMAIRQKWGKIVEGTLEIVK